jgi:TonB-linked SusC/RagA family outer membrane protein
MKKYIKIILITGFLLANLSIYSQESENVVSNGKSEKETVDLGFGIVKSENISTASTETVGSDVLEQRSAASLNDALYGRLLGLTALKSNGEFGGWVGGTNFGAKLNIRGIQTLTGEDDVLILVDGFPRRIDQLAIDEIESVTVLKDAAALAMYGYIGVNGAISVKTKRGPITGSKLSVKYNHKFTFGAETDKYADAYNYGIAMNEARNNDGLFPTFNQFELDAFKSGNYPFLYPNVDWMSESMRDVGSEDILSISYGNRTQRMNFFSMLNYTNSQGLLSGTEGNKEVSGYSTQLKYSKANIRMNLDVNMTSTTKMELNLLGSIGETNRPSSLTPDNLFYTLNTIPAGAFPVRSEDGKWGGDNVFTTSNPVARIDETGYYRGITVLLNADLKLTQSLENWIEGLSLSGRFGFDSYNYSYENRNRGFAWARDRYLFDSNGNVIDSDNNTIRQSGGSSTNSLTFSRGTNWQDRKMNLVLSSDFKRQFDEHSLSASLIYHSYTSVSYGRYNTFYRENFMGYLHYGLSEKYLADVVLTYTGSNRSYPNSWVFSPTVSLGWIISEEDFLKSNETINFLKLRGSYGMLHTDNVPRNGSIWMDIYDGGAGSFPFAGPSGGWIGAGGLGQTYIPTTDFDLETAHKYNIGLDAQILNSLDFTVEAYYQRRNNILMSEGGMNSALVGIASGYVNKGVVDSKGIEVGLDYIYNVGDLEFNLGGKYTVGVNKVIDAVEEPKPYAWLQTVGQPVRQVWGLEAIGFFKDETDISNSPIQEFSVVRPGDIKYQVQKGDNTVNTNDRIPIGYSSEVPKTNYAFNFGLEYKGLGFNVLFQGVDGFSQWDNYYWYGMPLVSNRNITLDYYENRWRPDNLNAKYPALTSQSNPNNEQPSTLWYKDASFLKLRNCEVYYKLPQSILERMSVSELKLSVKGENLHTWSSFRGIDPEMPRYVYPTLKGISAGLSISF